MNDNKSPGSNHDELLDLINRYSNENKSKMDDRADISRPQAHATTAQVPVAKAAPAVADTLPPSHYTEPEEGETTIRFAPEAGHFTDEGGRAVEGNLEQEETYAAVHFSGDESPEQKAKARAKAKRALKWAKRRNRHKRQHGSITIPLIKALAYTACVVILAFFTVFGFGNFWPGIIPMANDVFAFVKPDKVVEIELDDNMTTNQVAALLEKKGVIEEEKVYKFYVKYKYDEKEGKEDDDILGSIFDIFGDFCSTMFFGGEISEENDIEYISGTHTISAGMNYDQIISALTTTKYVREEITVTIPEGYSVEQIIELLTSNGIGDRDEYINAINYYPYKHEFVKLLEQEGYGEGRIYRLEGYLYPDTYIFYKDTDEVEVINRMLNTFSVRVWSNYYTAYKPVCEELGFTFDQMVTFASIVQAEGGDFSDFENISQVFHNRFDSTQFTRLESDAPIQYVLDIERRRKLREEGIKEDRYFYLTAEDLAMDSPYNTYKYEGLPVGAVCNPGLDAFDAALYPDMSDEVKKEFGLSKAYYFNSDMAGNLYYAQTPYQHELNKKKAEKVNQQIADGTYVRDEDE